MRPVVVYIDDESHNLTAFEASFDDNVDIRVFDSPLKALDELRSINPWVVATDQRMPGMFGVNLLEIVRKTHPYAKRVLITGYSDEDLVVEAVRKANVHEYIRKPWDVDDLNHRILKMIEVFQLERDLRLKTEALEAQNAQLKSLADELRAAKENEEKLRVELESWAPPFILKALNDSQVKFPIVKELALLTFDVVGSSSLHGQFVNERPVRSYLIRAFSEAVIRHGGWRESVTGDSAYAHFGLFQNVEKPAQATLAAANEIRVFLRNFSTTHNIQVECGFGLHIAKNCLVDLHTVKMETTFGTVIQKSFDTTSTEIDLVHRVERITHDLPGSNLAMTGEFVKSLGGIPPRMFEVGDLMFKGQKKPTHVFLKPSDLLTDSALVDFQSRILQNKSA